MLPHEAHKKHVQYTIIAEKQSAHSIQQYWTCTYPTVHTLVAGVWKRRPWAQSRVERNERTEAGPVLNRVPTAVSSLAECVHPVFHHVLPNVFSSGGHVPLRVIQYKTSVVPSWAFSIWAFSHACLQSYNAFPLWNFNGVAFASSSLAHITSSFTR